MTKKPAPMRTVSIGSLLTFDAAMRAERKNWTTSLTPYYDGRCEAIRAGRESFTKYPFADLKSAQIFIGQKCLAAGLETLGLKVKALP